MSPSQTHQQLLQVLAPELKPIVIEQTESVLLQVVRTNLNTQYASKTPLLAEFRDAVSARGTASDAELIHDFRRSVPLSDYDAYEPFLAAFNKPPYKEADLENLLAPGLPYILAISSSTSGREPKIFPYYNDSIPSIFSGEGPVAAIYFQGYRDIKCVEREPGQIVKKVLLSNGSCGMIRAMLGYVNVDDDDDRMSVIPPGLVAPLAASMIAHHKSFLIMHALFCLACRDLDRVILTFSTLFYDLMQHIDEEWDLFLSSIKNGTIPDLPGVGELHSPLQANLRANPDRAAELREIGPPLSCEGWARRVWPKLRKISFGCSGPFASVLPKVKSIIGPTIAIHSNAYACSESLIGPPYHPDDLHTFVLQTPSLIEFLDVTAEAVHHNLLQAWELETGKQYEVILTTENGLWRYRLGDVIQVVGFAPDNGSPVFVLSGRRSLSIRLAPVLISDTDLISSIESVGPEIMQVNEFATVVDDRQSPPTVGYLVELTGAPGPNAHLAPQKLSEGLAAANAEYQTVLEDAEVRIPTVRILKPGTFTAFRHWKAESMGVGPGQMKVPVVLLAEASREWVLERVVGEL